MWPKGRHFHGAVVVDDRFMYVLFGKSNGYHSDVHRFDTMLGAWERIEAPAVGVETPSKRYGHSVVQWRGDLYVFGGFDDFGLRCNDLWRYEWKRNSWSLIANLQSIEAPAAMHHCAVVLDVSVRSRVPHLALTSLLSRGPCTYGADKSAPTSCSSTASGAK